jgi:hypothetical protein
MLESKKNSLQKKSRGSTCRFFCGITYPAEFFAGLSAKGCLLRNFLRVLLQNYLQIVRIKVFCEFVLNFGSKFRRKISCRFQKPKENITYEGFSWKSNFAGNSAENMFPADFLSKSTGKSAGNKEISSSGS